MNIQIETHNITSAYTDWFSLSFSFIRFFMKSHLRCFFQCLLLVFGDEGIDRPVLSTFSMDVLLASCLFHRLLRHTFSDSIL